VHDHPIDALRYLLVNLESRECVQRTYLAG
jgi:hypothetical protein